MWWGPTGRQGGESWAGSKYSEHDRTQPSFFVRFIHNVIRKVRGGGGQRRRRGGGEDEGGSPRTTWYKGSQVREGDGGHDVGHDVGHGDSHACDHDHCCKFGIYDGEMFLKR